MANGVWDDEYGMVSHFGNDGIGIL